jgi:hypothetical protein
MLCRLLFITIAFGYFNICYAQETDSAKKIAVDTTVKTPPPVTITGSVDAYYRFNFSDPKPFINAFGSKVYGNSYTSFTNSQSSFELGMASIRADHSFGKVSATVDLGFGRRAEEFSYNDGSHPSLFAVKQLYASFQVTSALKFTLGKWGTHIGYEVLDAFANRNYSMDYMFSFGPFFHTGLKADITLSPTTALMIGVAKPTDFSTTESSTKVFIAQFSTGTKDGKLKAFLNYQGYGGVSDSTAAYSGYLFKSMNQFDLVINGTITSRFGIGLNGTVQSVKNAMDESGSWWGAAAYLNFDPTSTFGLTLRGEYFSDKHNIKIADVDGIGSGLNVFDLTLSALFKVGNLTIIPELRLDDASKNFFYKSDATTTKSTVSALLAVVYHF